MEPPPAPTSRNTDVSDEIGHFQGALGSVLVLLSLGNSGTEGGRVDRRDSELVIVLERVDDARPLVGTELLDQVECTIPNNTAGLRARNFERVAQTCLQVLNL